MFTSPPHFVTGGVRVFDHHADVPYAYRRRDWLSYEDEESITKKADWIRKNGLAGAMIFSLNHDDWQGTITAGRTFPLVSTVHRILTAPLPAPPSLTNSKDKGDSEGTPDQASGLLDLTLTNISLSK